MGDLSTRAHVFSRQLAGWPTSLLPPALLPPSSPITPNLSIQMPLPEIVPPIIFMSCQGHFCATRFSRLRSSSGQDLRSQRKDVNVSSPRCPSHHGNRSQHVFIGKAPGSQHAQTSRTENATVYRKIEFLACPMALKTTMVLL